jgi:hypothetical protein
MQTTPVLTVADDPPFVDRVADKVRTLAAVKPALVRLLEWQIDAVLENAPLNGVTPEFAESSRPTRSSM